MNDISTVAKIGSSEMTAKVGKLLRQAEGAAEGSPERDAFMERAMALSQAYSIDVAVARANTAKAERVEEPEQRKYEVGSFTHGRANVKTNEHMVDLMLAIASAHDMRSMISHSRIFVFAYGMPSDHEVAERMFAMLSVQMVAEADAALKAGANKVLTRVRKQVREDIPERERQWNGWTGRGDLYFDGPDDVEVDFTDADGTVHYAPIYDWNGRERQPRIPPKTRLVNAYDADGSPIYEDKVRSTLDARLWRANFYQAFVIRTRQRLAKARRDALREAGIDVGVESKGSLALRDKAADIEAAFEEHNKVVLATGRSYGGAKVTSYDATAHRSGTAAADRATIGDEREVR